MLDTVTAPNATSTSSVNQFLKAQGILVDKYPINSHGMIKIQFEYNAPDDQPGLDKLRRHIGDLIDQSHHRESSPLSAEFRDINESAV